MDRRVLERLLTAAGDDHRTTALLAGSVTALATLGVWPACLRNAAPLAAMASEVLRGGLTALALWWLEHPEVPREQIVAVAMNLFWVGLERVTSGELWTA